MEKATDVQRPLKMLLPTCYSRKELLKLRMIKKKKRRGLLRQGLTEKEETERETCLQTKDNEEEKGLDSFLLRLRLVIGLSRSCQTDVQYRTGEEKEHLPSDEEEEEEGRPQRPARWVEEKNRRSRERKKKQEDRNVPCSVFVSSPLLLCGKGKVFFVY